VIKPTSETAFEGYIEHVLTGRSGWRKGSLEDWDVKLAVFKPEVLAFIKKTQPALWDQMQKLHGAELETKLIDALCKELDVKGTLNVLRHGFKFYSNTFQAAYFKPAHGLNPDVQKLYEGNRLTVTRQVPCHPREKSDKGTRPLDLVFAINGLPVATCELKNPNTHQTWRHAVA
jgi:type I restriction enzyme, R subunit